MTINTTRRGALATVAGGAVALTGTAAAYAYQPPEPLVIDPAEELAAQWWTARNNLAVVHYNKRPRDERERQWRSNVRAAKDVEEQLRHVTPTTMAGAIAVLTIAIDTINPDGIQVLHHHLACDRVVMLDWLRNAHAAMVAHGEVGQ